ncbi:hypothetical protein A9Q99_17560 [Gammaproteobacteria bacterium 45_16_T64]|nr:hypothetical protein A9Q99_17560 [Gammaproteobacteria bacterium 45_16_T64]
MNIKTHIANLAFITRSRLGLDVLDQYPVEHYLHFFNCDSTRGPYTNFPGYLSDWFDAIVANKGEAVLQEIHRLALLKLMNDSLKKIESMDVSISIREAIHTWYRDICSRVEDREYCFDANHDYFKKDIQIASLRLWPTSSICHFERAGISRTTLLSGGLVQASLGLKTLMFDLKGKHTDLFELHMEDRRTNPYFMEGGWERLYSDLAEEMLLHPEVPGVFAQSWFWDPAVGEISKNTRYLRTIPEQGGATFFRLGEDHAPNHPALKHKKRRRLCAEGAYIPTRYLMIWPREKLIRWYKRKQEQDMLAINIG